MTTTITASEHALSVKLGIISTYKRELSKLGRGPMYGNHYAPGGRCENADKWEDIIIKHERKVSRLHDVLEALEAGVDGETLVKLMAKTHLLVGKLTCYNCGKVGSVMVSRVENDCYGEPYNYHTCASCLRSEIGELTSSLKILED